jgi:hypothetical protein
MRESPAVVLSPSRDVLLWNPLGRALLAWHLTEGTETGPRQDRKRGPAPGTESSGARLSTAPPSGAGPAAAEPRTGGLNSARMLFRDPRSRHLYPQWARETALEAAVLRQAADSYPDDPALAALIGELRDTDQHFASIWPRVAARVHAFGIRRFLHPVAGPLELAYENLQFVEPGPSVLVFSAEPHSPSERALRTLSSKAAARG